MRICRFVVAADDDCPAPWTAIAEVTGLDHHRSEPASANAPSVRRRSVSSWTSCWSSSSEERRTVTCPSNQIMRGPMSRHQAAHTNGDLNDRSNRGKKARLWGRRAANRQRLIGSPRCHQSCGGTSRIIAAAISGWRRLQYFHSSFAARE